MKFDELSKKAQEIKAPGIEKNTIKSNQTDAIIYKLKSVDSKTRRGIRIIQIVYVFFILFLICFMITVASLSLKTGIGLIAIAFLIVIFIQQLRYWKYNYSYANSPVMEFLNKAKKRMKVFTPRTWIVIPVWGLLDAGLCIIIKEIFPLPQYLPLTILLLQVILLLAIVLDFYSAYLVWKKEHKPVITEIDKMLKELQRVEYD